MKFAQFLVIKSYLASHVEVVYISMYILPIDALKMCILGFKFCNICKRPHNVSGA